MSLAQQEETLLASSGWALTGFWPGDQFTEAFTEGAFYPLGLSHWLLGLCDLEARVGIEPTHKAFAEPCLTTWLPRHCRVAEISAVFLRRKPLVGQPLVDLVDRLFN